MVQADNETRSQVRVAPQLAEGKPLDLEDANRIWVTILEIKEDDWGIGGHTDWLRDYESALDTLGLELKPRM